MNGFSGSPKLLKGGIVVADPVSLAVKRVITLQYNPETVTRTLVVQGTGGGERSEALRLTGPANETIKVDAELDATDQLEFPDQNATALEVGLHPQIAVLEALINPTVTELVSGNTQLSLGTIEIAPTQAPLTLFVWSPQRIVPVRITEFSVVEDSFDERLNPIRAKVTLGMRVLSVDDLGFGHPGGTVFLGHLRRKEALAARAKTGDLKALGIGGIR
ncbi:MAG: hypothetical protein ABUS56_02180 [Acidobacteriota bacterium]